MPELLYSSKEAVQALLYCGYGWLDRVLLTKEGTVGLGRFARSAWHRTRFGQTEGGEQLTVGWGGGKVV
jgi:hypothetical protein